MSRVEQCTQHCNMIARKHPYHYSLNHNREVVIEGNAIVISKIAMCDAIVFSYAEFFKMK